MLGLAALAFVLGSWRGPVAEIEPLITTALYLFGALMATLSLRRSHITRLLGPSEHVLDEYAADCDFLDDWTKLSQARLWQIGSFFVLMLGSRSAALFLTSDPGYGKLVRDPLVDGATMVAFTVMAACYSTTCFCTLHLTAGLELAVDSFAVLPEREPQGGGPGLERGAGDPATDVGEAERLPRGLGYLLHRGLDPLRLSGGLPEPFCLRLRFSGHPPLDRVALPTGAPLPLHALQCGCRHRQGGSTSALGELMGLRRHGGAGRRAAVRCPVHPGQPGRILHQRGAGDGLQCPEDLLLLRCWVLHAFGQPLAV
ncbi:unnamed protein product, partial [Symbiodinium necroappetens]